MKTYSPILNTLDFNIEKLSDDIFLLTLSKLEVSKNLSSTKYDEFSPEKEFAGLSYHKKLLSVKDSIGPANFCGYRIIIEPPKSLWTPYSTPGLILNTDDPDICIDVLGKGLFVNNNNLIDRYTVNYYNTSEKDPEFSPSLDGDISTIIDLYTTFHRVQICQYYQGFNIVIPLNAAIHKEIWKKLNRFVVTDIDIATYKETIPIQQHNRMCTQHLWLPCTKPSEVELLYGIRGNPIEFCEGKLEYDTVEVVDPLKASNIAACFRIFGGKKLHFTGNYGGAFYTLESFLKNQKLVETLNEVVICLENNTIQLDRSPAILNCIDYPLIDEKSNSVYCPKSLIDKYFYSLKNVCKRYNLEEILKFTIFNTHPEKGNWVFKADVDSLTPIDRKAISASRVKRETDLRDKYGTLPDNWESFEDQHLHKYFEIQEKVKTGIIMPLDNSPVIPEEHAMTFFNWLMENKHAVYCRVAQTHYVTNFATIDDLVEIPGFWQILGSITKDANWIKRLIVSKAAQTHAMAQLF